MSLTWESLGPDEARALFDEHVADHPAALERFASLYTSNRGKQKELTYQPGSLVPIFAWAMKRFRLPPAPLPASEAESPAAATVHWARFQPVDYCQLGHELATVADGIGSYVSELLLRTDGRARWWLEPDRKSAGYHQPGVRVGGGLWLSAQAAALCSKGWRKLELGYGNRADDPDRLAEHVAAVLDRAGSPVDPVEPGGAFSVEADGLALHLVFSDEAFTDESANDLSDTIDRFVVDAAQLASVDRARREDRELVIVDVSPSAATDAAIADLEALWPTNGV